jgi:hypothetical protein
MFAIYKRIDDTGTHQFVRPADGLGGGSGPIAAVIRRETPAAPPADFQFLKWHLNEAELLKDFLTEPEKAAINSYKLIIDLKPTSEDELLFFEICDIWGCSDPAWTPLMLRLSFTYEAAKKEEIQEVRRTWRFKAEHECQQSREFVYEFLYLTHGWEKGRWGWGTVGAVNGTLLFPAHMPFFLEAMEFDRSSG